MSKKIKKLDLEPFRNQEKKTWTKYVWWIEESVYDGIWEICKDQGIKFPSVVMRYIMNWSCDKIENDEEFRNHMKSIAIQQRSWGETKVKKAYSLGKELNDRVQEVRIKYGLFNLALFVNESAKWFLEEYKK